MTDPTDRSALWILRGGTTVLGAVLMILAAAIALLAAVVLALFGLLALEPSAPITYVSVVAGTPGHLRDTLDPGEYSADLTARWVAGGPKSIACKLEVVGGKAPLTRVERRTPDDGGCGLLFDVESRRPIDVTGELLPGGHTEATLQITRAAESPFGAIFASVWPLWAILGSVFAFGLVAVAFGLWPRSSAS